MVFGGRLWILIVYRGIFYEHVRYTKIDISKGILEYTMTRNSETHYYNDIFLVHSGTSATRKALYNEQVQMLNLLMKKGEE